MILNLWVRHKWFLAIFTGHFPMCAPLLVYFTRCIQFNTILFLLVYPSEKHFPFFFLFQDLNTTLASLGMSNTLVFLKLKLSNTSQTTFILCVLINLYNIQPPKGLSSPSQPVFLIPNFSGRTIKLIKATSGFVGKCLVPWSNLSGICSLMTFLLIDYKVSPSFMFLKQLRQVFSLPVEGFQASLISHLACL